MAGVQRISTTLLLCVSVLALAALLPASASAVGEPIARFTCSAPGLVCDPCPVHCSSPSGSVAPGVPVAFDGTPSSDDRIGQLPGEITAWEWNFGDGATATGSQVSHAFAGPGTYPVSIMVTDNEGKADFKVLSIEVADPPPPLGGEGYAATVLADGPVSYWRLGESAGSSAANAVNGPAGAYTGTHTLGVPGAISGDSAVALGAGYVSVTHSGVLNTADNFTLEAWVKRTTINASAGLFAKGSKAYQVYFDAGNRLILRQSAIGEIARSTSTLTDRTSFHHIAITKNGPDVHLYIDGADRTSTVTNRTILNTTNDLGLGAGTGYLNSTLDDVAIYNRALPATTIATHHNTATRPAG